jgi:putative autotransporter adhesin-like protein
MALGGLLIAILVVLLVDRISFHSATTPAAAGSGVAATEVRSLPRFSGVDLTGSNNVVVRVRPRQSVVVHGDSNLLRQVITRVRADALVIGTTPGSFSTKSPMFVQVSVPWLDALSLHGAGNIIVTGVDSPRLTVALPGSGNIVATGTTTKLDVTLSGEGTVRLGQLTARDAKAALGGSGTIMLTATHSLAARVSGSGTVRYSGNPPHVTQRVTGSGTIIAG